MVIILL